MPRTLKNTDYQKGTGIGKFGDIRIGTWNIRTLFKTGAMKTIIDEIKRYKLPVVALQEIRWPGNGSIKSYDTTLFYSGGASDRHEFGVGFMINEALLTKVSKFEVINERLCYIRFSMSNYDLIIINCHASTEEKEEEVKNAFYEDLERVYDTLPRHSVKLVIGDMNAKLGQEEEYKPTIGRESLHNTSNDNGTRFVNFATSRDVIISSTYFRRKNIHKQTWISPDGRTCNQIDHLAIDKEHRSWIKNIRSFRGADGDTDHYLVVATMTKKFSTSWKLKKGKSKLKMLNVEKVKDPIEVNRYRNNISEEVKRIKNQQCSTDDNQETRWKNIKATIDIAAKDLRT